MQEEEYDWYDHDMEHLAKAMLKAQEAFNQYFDDQSLDGAYWDLRLKGHKLSSEFNPWRALILPAEYEKENEETATTERLYD